MCTLVLLAAGAAPDAPRLPPAVDPIHVIAPTDPDASDRRLGEAVAADGDLLVVAAPTDGDDALEPGRVTIHRLLLDAERDLLVRKEQTIISPWRAPGDHFGASVAVLRQPFDADSREFVAVGADRANAGPGDAGSMAGAVVVFERAAPPASTGAAPWRLASRLHAGDPEPGAAFGAAIAFDRAGSARIAVGAPRHDAVGAFDAGRVHVFERTPTAKDSAGGVRWIEVASVDPPSPRMSQWFGAAVAIDDAILAIASPGDDVMGADGRDAVPAAGAVYLYRRIAVGGSPTRARYRLERVLTAPTPEHSAWFGLAIDLDDGVLAVGAPRARDLASGSSPVGCVLLFDLEQPEVPPKRIDPPKPSAAQGFGQMLALRGGILVVGAPSTDVTERDARARAIEDGGAAWVYALPQGDFAAALNPPKPLPSGLFGSSCAVGEAAGARTNGAYGPTATATGAATVAIVGHRFVEEESTAPSRGAALFMLPADRTAFASTRPHPAPP